MLSLSRRRQREQPDQTDSGRELCHLDPKRPTRCSRRLATTAMAHESGRPVAARPPSRWCSTSFVVHLTRNVRYAAVPWGTVKPRGSPGRGIAGRQPTVLASLPPATLTAMSKTLRDRREALRGAGPRARAAGPVREARGLPGGPRARDHLGGRASRAARRARRVRPEVQALADGRPADRARPLQAGRARRALAQADVGRHRPARPRRRRRGRQRLRRRARGRADLRLPVREGQGRQAGQPAVADLDDQRGDARGVRSRCARPPSSRRSSRPRGRARRPTGSSA